VRNQIPKLIVSGGQTGADRAALDFAIAHDIPHGGFCPRGRKAEDGPIPDRYSLTETKTDEYPERTRQNIAMADATVIFATVPEAELIQIRRSGSGLTVREAKKQGRPYVVLSHFPDVKADADELAAFLHRQNPKTLNVAGSRESSQPGVAAHVAAVLELCAQRTF